LGLIKNGRKMAPRAPWERLGRGPGTKMGPTRVPKEPPEEPKSGKHRIKFESFLPSAPGRFQDLSPGRPGDHFKTIFNDLGVDFLPLWEHIFVIFHVVLRIPGSLLVGSW